MGRWGIQRGCGSSWNPSAPFVALRHVRFRSLPELVAAMERIIDTGGQGGTPVDYLDGVVFSADESYLCVGRRTTTPGPVSDYTGQKHLLPLDPARRTPAWKPPKTTG